jgi:hypothetical protein
MVYTLLVKKGGQAVELLASGGWRTLRHNGIFMTIHVPTLASFYEVDRGGNRAFLMEA